MLLLGAVGEIIIEKTGHLNLGIPGTMCVGGLFGCYGLVLAGGAAPVSGFTTVLCGVLFAFLGAALMGALYSFLTVTLRANQNITGLILTTLGSGISVYFMKGISITELENSYLKFRITIPTALERPLTLENGVLIVLAVLVAVAATLVLRYTRTGLHLRAVGENPATADAAGINVAGYKYWGTIIGSGIAGIGGFSFMVNRGSMISDIVPFGWMAVALVIFVMWKPALGILGALLFSFLSILPNSGVIPGIGSVYGLKQVFEMLPYLVTIIVLVITSMRKKRENQPPASLGLNYFREDR